MAISSYDGRYSFFTYNMRCNVYVLVCHLWQQFAVVLMSILQSAQLWTCQNMSSMMIHMKPQCGEKSTAGGCHRRGRIDLHRGLSMRMFLPQASEACVVHLHQQGKASPIYVVAQSDTVETYASSE